MPAPLALDELLDRLEAHYGEPPRLPPRTALDWVLWENVGYLIDDAKRTVAFRALKKATRNTPGGILALRRDELLAIARLGGMHPELRVQKLLDIAQTIQDEDDGDLERALALPLAKARKAMKRFPGIGAPGADRILVFTDAHAVPALDSNGLRVLTRVGLASEEKDYARTYRGAMRVLEPYAERGCAYLRRAYDVLRAHGRTLCKNTSPLCEDCPLEARCPSA